MAEVPPNHAQGNGSEVLPGGSHGPPGRRAAWVDQSLTENIKGSFGDTNITIANRATEPVMTEQENLDLEKKRKRPWSTFGQTYSHKFPNINKSRK